MNNELSWYTFGIVFDLTNFFLPLNQRRYCTFSFHIKLIVYYTNYFLQNVWF